MKKLIVDEGVLTLTPQFLIFEPNGRGVARGLSSKMTVPYKEIVNVEDKPLGDSAEITFTLLKDDYRFSVNYQKASHAQAGQFLDVLNNLRPMHSEPVPQKVTFSPKGREKTTSEKIMLGCLGSFLGVIGLFVFIGLLGAVFGTSSEPVASPTSAPSQSAAPTEQPESVTPQPEAGAESDYAAMANANRAAFEKNMPELLSPYVASIEIWTEEKPNAVTVRLEKTYDALLIKEQDGVKNLLMNAWVKTVKKNRAGNEKAEMGFYAPDGSFVDLYQEP